MKTSVEIDKLRTDIQSLRDELHKKNADLSVAIRETNSNIVKAQSPANLESDILVIAKSAINDSIKSVLTGFNSPLSKLVCQTVEQHSLELKSIINNAFSTVIKTDNFKESIVNAFSHKVSRAIISNNDGLFDKVSNELKQDAVFKAKMSLAVANVVEECLKERK